MLKNTSVKRTQFFNFTLSIENTFSTFWVSFSVVGHRPEWLVLPASPTARGQVVQWLQLQAVPRWRQSDTRAGKLLVVSRILWCCYSGIEVITGNSSCLFIKLYLFVLGCPSDSQAILVRSNLHGLLGARPGPGSNSGKIRPKNYENYLHNSALFLSSPIVHALTVSCGQDIKRERHIPKYYRYRGVSVRALFWVSLFGLQFACLDRCSDAPTKNTCSNLCSLTDAVCKTIYFFGDMF